MGYILSALGWLAVFFVFIFGMQISCRYYHSNIQPLQNGEPVFNINTEFPYESERYLDRVPDKDKAALSLEIEVRKAFDKAEQANCVSGRPAHYWSENSKRCAILTSILSAKLKAANAE